MLTSSAPGPDATRDPETHDVEDPGPDVPPRPGRPDVPGVGPTPRRVRRRGPRVDQTIATRTGGLRPMGSPPASAWRTLGRRGETRHGQARGSEPPARRDHARHGARLPLS